MEFSNLSQMFYYRAERHRKKRYISFEDTHYTYEEASAIISRIARLFQQKGVKKGTRVAVLLNNSPEFVFSVFALFTCGAVVIPINVFLKSREITYIVDNSETEFLISSGAFSDVISEVRKSSSKIKEVFSYDNSIPYSVNLYDESKRMSSEPLSSSSKIDDLAVFIYTSGTTGHPKGAMLTHRNILSNLSGIAVVLGSSEKDRFLVMLPMFHTYTFTACLMLPAYQGASIIILSSVMDMKKKSFKKILIFQRPTFMLGIPQVFAALAKSPMPAWFIKLLYPVKKHISGGAPLPMEIFEQFKSKFGMSVIEGYGLSEASPVVSFNPLDNPKPGTVGVALPNIQVKIVDQDEIEVPRGSVGELIIKGDNVMYGYWGMPKATDDAIRNGWLFTGDMASMDENGYITIVDRKKDLIITKGMNVYPREIEEVIYKFPGVEAAAVIGLPSLEQGETVTAYIQPLSGNIIDEKELRAYLRLELANYKQPRIIKIIKNIPLTATGKVLKRQLKDMIKAGKIS